MKFYLLTFFFFAAWIGAPAHAQTNWAKNYSQARALAQQTGKPLFIDFYADWCGYCRKLDAEVFPSAAFQSEARGWILLKVNTDGAGAALAQQFRVQGLPTLVLCAPNGGIVKRFDGFPPPATLLQTMQSVRAAYAVSPAKSQQKTSGQTGAKAPVKTHKQTPIQKSGAAKMAASKNWEKMPEIQAALRNGNMSGVILLDENGAKPLSKPTAKSKTEAASR